MITLLTNSISIRGEEWKVRELDGKTMREVVKRLRDAPETTQAFIAFKCAVNPKFESEGDAANAPQLVIRMISDEAYRLSTPEKPKEGEEKNA